MAAWGASAGRPYGFQCSLQQRQASGAPPAVEQTYVLLVQGTRVVLLWDPPANNGTSAILRYSVSMETAGLSNAPTISSTSSSTPMFMAEGLQPGAFYAFSIAAVNGAGSGPYSSSIVVQTGEPEFRPLAHAHSLTADWIQ